jgi:ABC-type transport system involved in cytochrome c biogenesis permease subunit
MKKLLPWLVLLCALGLAAIALVPPHNHGPLDVVDFSRLPVLVNGRVKPLDTVARNSLLVFQGRLRVAAADNHIYTSAELIGNFFAHGTSEVESHVLTPIEWLLDVSFRGDVADGYQTFEIVHPEVLAIFNLTPEAGEGNKRFSFKQLDAGLTELERQAKLAESVDTQARSPFQKAVVRLRDNLVLYQRLKNSLVSAASDNFLDDLIRFQKALPAGIAAVRAKQAGAAHDEAAAQIVISTGQSFVFMERAGYLLPIPPDDAKADPNAWKSTGAALLETFETGSIHPVALTYAYLGQAWHDQQAEQFNKLVDLYRGLLAKRLPVQVDKCAAEARFNAASPFSKSMVLYVGAFLLALCSWLKWPDALGRSALWLVTVAWLLTTAGILTRMWLEGRPPVTNLYSSALFIGWGSVALCLVLEQLYKNGIGSVAAGVIGFSTLLIGQYLALEGDTLEMMRAVLDSNFWLGTHVVVVATGYASTFLAGFLALIYVIRGVFTRSLDKATADALGRMVYGIVCFATLFSLVGTVLGGIWADQSWGRFWGWDPKENGALIIVIWNAIILHARWGGLVKQRGLMALAIFGNIVTSWSWFGVNMLGVGLHSYGFMEAAFWWLLAFVGTQLAMIAIANLPLEKWRSFQRT